PPTRPLLPPCGTTAVRVSLASLRIAATSSTVPGRSTTGVRPRERSRISTRYASCKSGSVMAYFSPTIFLNASIRSGGNAGLDWMFIRLSRFRGGSPLQPVVDRLAEPFMGDRHHGDGARSGGVERAQMGKQVGRGLDQVAPCGQVEHGTVR